ASEGEMDSPPVLFEVGSELGESYVSAMELAGEYAYAGRDVVVGKVLEILGAEAVHEVHNHHNFAWREDHFGRTYWVIRKGCTPARPGQEGFVGGSMGDESVILAGVAGADAEQSLFSTVHGAGRVMSRSQAAGRVRRRKRWICRNRECDRVVAGEGACADLVPDSLSTMSDEAAERRARFRALHDREQLFVMPNPWDVGSARLLQSAGFEALATTSAGFAWSVGKLDQTVSREELVAHV